MVPWIEKLTPLSLQRHGAGREPSGKRLRYPAGLTERMKRHAKQDWVVGPAGFYPK